MGVPGVYHQILILSSLFHKRQSLLDILPENVMKCDNVSEFVFGIRI